MNNSVTFYKVPWTNSSLNQPYFMTENDRDSYLQDNCYPFVVLQKVNINLLTDMNVELKVPIDITVAQNYNFCKIEYNGSKYFACIIDYSQISVGYTYVYTIRHPLSEITNYLSLFENFQFSHSTVASNLWYKYGINSFILPPQHRTYVRFQNAGIQCKIKKTSGNTETVHSIDKTAWVTVLFLDNAAIKNKDTGSEYNPFTILNIVRTFSCVVYVPIIDILKDHINISIRCYNNGNYEDCIVPYLTINQMEELSPYIKGALSVKLPLISINSSYYLPYTWQKVEVLLQGDISGGSGTYNDGFALYSTAYDVTLQDQQEISFKYTVPLPLIKEDYFNYIDLIIYSAENKISFKPCDICSNYLEFTPSLDFYIIFNENGTNIVCQIKPDENDVQAIKNYTNKNLIFNFNLLDNFSYAIDADAEFAASNRYYDALTKNVLRQQAMGGLIQAAQNANAGLAEQAFSGSKTVSLGTSQTAFRNSQTKRGYTKLTLNRTRETISESGASQALAYGNYGRAVGGLMETGVNMMKYANEREMIAKQYNYAPDVVISGNLAEIRNFLLDGFIGIVKYFSLNEEIDNYEHDLSYDGVPVILRMDEFDFSKFVNNNRFYIKCSAEIKSTTLINDLYYTNFLTLMDSGCRYFIVGSFPTNSNKLDEEVSNEP